MAQITRDGKPDIATPATPATDRLSGAVLGVNVAKGDVLYLDDDGLWKKSIASSATVESRFGMGIAPEDMYAGQPITPYEQCRMHYGTGLTPGVRLYVSASVAGGLQDTAPYVGAMPVGYVMEDGTKINFRANWQEPALA